MGKFKAEIAAGNGKDQPSAAAAEGHEADAADESEEASSNIVTTVATIGVIGVAAALWEATLIPGMIIGVAAAFAPRVVPKLGERLQPLFNSTVRGAYKITKKARSAVAEAHERINDIAAEVDAEHAAEPAPKPTAGAAA